MGVPGRCLAAPGSVCPAPRAATGSDAFGREVRGEPPDVLDRLFVVWAVRHYAFAAPLPGFAPERGITGLASYLEMDLPPSDVFPVLNIETLVWLTVEVRVGAVVVDWGDGSPAARWVDPGPATAVGHPDGSLSHIYEAAGIYHPEVSYAWVVRWRAPGGPWNAFEVEPTTAGAAYPIDQVVARVVR